MTAPFAGETIFNAGFASSCSPRAFIRSTIFCGRGTSVSVCVAGGVTVVVAVVLLLSGAVAHDAKNKAKAGKARETDKTFRCRFMISSSEIQRDCNSVSVLREWM